MIDELFLTDDEIKTLTGYRQVSKQIVQLRAQRIPFHLTHTGHPRVTRAAVEGRRVPKEPSKKDTQTWSPSWGANAV